MLNELQSTMQTNKGQTSARCACLTLTDRSGPTADSAAAAAVFFGPREMEREGDAKREGWLEACRRIRRKAACQQRFSSNAKGVAGIGE